MTATATFLDASAIVKLVVHEPESLALIDHLDGLEFVEASELSVSEVGRAVRRAFHDFDERDVSRGIALHRVTGEVLRLAARVASPNLRTLDAIHLATALTLGTTDVEVVTYDDRMAAAARLHGLRVVQPGRA